MKFKYRYYKDAESEVTYRSKLPLLEVRLEYAGNHIDLDCLLDSGAGDSLFSQDIADVLGIDLSQAHTRQYYGIGDTSVKGYLHSVRLRIKGFTEWITIEAGFIENDQMPLLGQSGVFENYDITFRGYKGRFEINPKSRVRRLRMR